MDNLDQKGAANSVMLVLVVVSLLFIIVCIFAIWAFGSRQDYKNNVDTKIAAAVSIAKQQTQVTDANNYAQEAKSPLKTYTGPEAYGSLVVNYPKTWSSYVDDTGNGAALVDGYFEPGTVPSIQSQNSVFALRIQVQQEAYDQVLSQFTSQAQSGMSTVSSYSLPKLPNVIGSEVTGSIGNNKKGILIILPLRTDTIELWTEAPQYYSDFSTYILPNFSFSP